MLDLPQLTSSRCMAYEGLSCLGPAKALHMLMEASRVCTCCAVASSCAVLLCCQLHALQGDLELLSKYLQPPGCSVNQATAVLDSSIPVDMIHAVMAGLELLARASSDDSDVAESATSEAAKSLTEPLDLLGRPLLFFVSTCGSARVVCGGSPDAGCRMQSRLRAHMHFWCGMPSATAPDLPASASFHTQHASQRAGCGRECCSVQ